ncbi:MAG TPA: cobyrinate a,c-diamide synthase [Candidatus Anaerotruncus excrementipullorum]|uniref:Cobyrinate a,c-diamide synthase n=1 Tax=Candidatus Anaerotruncus excrementipullorum TaxID=2838465 RepID=A0A9D1WRZ6_9FIRM|nr:cobyrinate a,c-diamide synthase [Candidatus Anaerotruncus excrementipullorum]
MTERLPRLLLAAPASGSGKTTATCAILRALVLEGVAAASFKCGPDYIDPMFHRACVGVRRAGNLDLFFSTPQQVRRLLAQGAAGAQIAVLEGAMGLYDGIACTEDASAYQLARQTQTPILLVVDARGMALSVCAQIKGLREFRPDAPVAGVLLNRVSPGLYPELKAAVERECGLPVAGYLPRLPQGSLESRHLGLVTAGEVADLRQRLDALAAQAKETVDFDLLWRIARSAPPLRYEPELLPQLEGRPVIAVAQDRAFCFYYQETLELLEALGARLCPFSPLEDGTLPPGTQGMLLGGGYPELYAAQLAENLPMRRAVAAAVAAGLPTIAECGGFLYLHRTLQDPQGNSHPMAGALDGEGLCGQKLGRFGYVTLRARTGGLLCPEGETLAAHEFHYWQSTQPGADFWAQKPHRQTGWAAGRHTRTLYAGFPHLYLPGAPQAAVRFLQAAAGIKEEATWN